jgi:hypothetical protein
LSAVPCSRPGLAAPISRTRHVQGTSSVVCAAKPSRKRKSRRNQRPRKGGDSKNFRDEHEMTSAFVEDVDKPLEARKFGEPRMVIKQRELDEKEKRRIGKIFERGNTLELLKQATWVGVFVLVGIFFLTHLVIVRDWLPKSADPSM